MSLKRPLTSSPSNVTAPAKSWRDAGLPIHPAANEFPLLKDCDPEALKALGEDIRKHGLQLPIVMIPDNTSSSGYSLIDGRNRLDAMEAVGIQFKLFLKKIGGLGSTWELEAEKGINLPSSSPIELETNQSDPYALVASLNVHRRHFTPETKRELITKLLKMTPEKSDRQIAETTKSNRNTVGRVRAEMEKSGDVSLSDTRTDKRGREQPSSKVKKPIPDCPVCGGKGTELVRLTTLCGRTETSEPQPVSCLCMTVKRRGNATLYEDLRKHAERKSTEQPTEQAQPFVEMAAKIKADAAKFRERRESTETPSDIIREANLETQIKRVLAIIQRVDQVLRSRTPQQHLSIGATGNVELMTYQNEWQHPEDIDLFTLAKELGVLEPSKPSKPSKPSQPSKSEPLAWELWEDENHDRQGDEQDIYLAVVPGDTADRRYRIRPGLTVNKKIRNYLVDEFVPKREPPVRNLVPKQTKVKTLDQAKSIAQADFDKSEAA